MEFEWDATKAAVNERKHGLSFPLASLVFLDDDRLEKLDERVTDEERRITIGLVRDREIVVASTMRGKTIRLISARRADKHERKEYWDSKV